MAGDKAVDYELDAGIPRLSAEAGDDRGSSLGDRLRRGIEEDILAGRLLPGDRLDERALAERFNKAIAEIRANGTYQQVQDKYFKYDIYGQ